jgi:hypothetical protein
MIDISFEINGRKVTQSNMDNALESALLQSMQESITKSVGAARCPAHGQSPKIKVMGRNLNSLSFEVSGCCNQLIETVNKNLK